MRTYFLLLLLSPTTLFSQDIEQLTTSATNGDLDSQFDLAISYFHGNGAKQDYKKAFFWFEKAAIQDEPTSQFNLGMMYDEGLGVNENNNKAKEWYLKAADKGYCGAYQNLGLGYELGEFGKKNINEAINWYKKGINNNCYECAYTLGTLYLYETSLDNRKENAIKWFEKAASNRHMDAMMKLSVLYFYPSEVSNDIDFSTNIEKAIHWSEKAALYNNKNAFRRLGHIYELGNAIDENFTNNYERANYFYKRAADLDDNLALYYYGLNLFSGHGVDKDEKHGLELIQETAKNGEIEAELKLGELYFFGNTVDLDKNIAWKWLNKVLEREVKGYYAIDLAESYSEDIETIELAFEFYLISAKEGYGISQYNIGLMYKDGIGTETNIDKAKEWFKKASMNDVVDAEYELIKLSNNK